MVAAYLAESLSAAGEAAATSVEVAGARWSLVVLCDTSGGSRGAELLVLALPGHDGASVSSEFASRHVSVRVAGLVGGRDAPVDEDFLVRVDPESLLAGTELQARAAALRPGDGHVVPLRAGGRRQILGFLVNGLEEVAADAPARARRLQLGIALSAAVGRSRDDAAAERSLLALGTGAARDGDVASVLHAALHAVALGTSPARCSVQLIDDGAPTARIARDVDGAGTWHPVVAGPAPDEAVAEVLSTLRVVVATPDSAGGSDKPSTRALAPVVVDGRLAAILEAAWHGLPGDVPLRVEAIERVGRHLSAALGIALCGCDAASTEDKLAIVARTAGRIASAPRLEVALEALLHGVGALSGAETGAVLFPVDADLLFGKHRIYRLRGGSRFDWEEVPIEPGSRLDLALRSGRPTYERAMADLGGLGATNPHDRPAPGGLAIIPLPSRGHVVGALVAGTARLDGFDSDDLAWLRMLGDLAGALVAEAQFHLEADRRLRGIEAAQRIAQAVNAQDDVDGMLQRMLDDVVEVTQSDYGSVLLVDPTARSLRARVGFRLPPGLLEAAVYPLYAEPDPREDVFSRVVREGSQIVVESEDYPAFNRSLAEQFREPRHRRLLTPIRDGRVVVGILSLLWTGDRVPRDEDFALCQVVADQAGTAIDRARLAEAERSARQRLAAALQAANTMVLTFDAKGIIDSVAGSVETLTGRSPDELLNRSVLDLQPPAERAFVACKLGEWNGGGDEPLRIGTAIVHRTGRTVPVFHAAKPQRIAGKFVGGAGAFTDLSALSDLRSERDEARSLQARVEGAVRTGRAVAHELGSPISTVLALTELLADEPLPADVLDDLRTLHHEALRASRYLHQFARISRYSERPTPAGPQLDVDESSPGS